MAELRHENELYVDIAGMSHVKNLKRLLLAYHISNDASQHDAVIGCKNLGICITSDKFDCF